MREAGALRVAQKLMQGLGLQLAPQVLMKGVYFYLSVCVSPCTGIACGEGASKPPPPRKKNVYARLAAAASHPGLPDFNMNVVLFG
jgi:hypothetical protein